MADPLAVASGVVTLATFALQSSQALYQVIESFKNNKRVIRELEDELEALGNVLTSLHQTDAGSDATVASLTLPLLRCGKACKDFEAIIARTK